MTSILVCSNYRERKIGYARQMHVWLPRLKRAGYDLTMFALTDTFGEPFLDRDGIVTVGRRWDSYGNDIYPSHMEFFAPDFSLGLGNGWVMDAKAYEGYPHAQWEAVDSFPLRPGEYEFLRACHWTIAMSRFGEQVLRGAGFDPLYVPHGIDGRVFRPVDRGEARARLQARIDAHEQARGFPVTLDGKFLIAMNGANATMPARKGWYEALAAFKAFHARHPESVLYLHTALLTPEGVDIKKDIEMLGLPVGSVAYPNQYFYLMGMAQDGELNDLYNAADVFFHPSHTEGFGLPIMEAQMTGCPVIVTDASAMSEMAECGIKVPGVAYEAQRGWFWNRPAVDDLVEALEEVHSGMACIPTRESIAAWAQQYEAENVLNNYMLPALKRIEAELGETDEQRLTRRLGERRQVAVNGVELAIHPGMGDQAIVATVQREYFPDLIDYSTVKRAVDVGAHIGAWSLWVKQMSPDARIVAIEAMPENAELLRRNCNGKNAGSITVLEGMCGYTPGEYDMLINPANSGGQTLVKRGDANLRGRKYSIRRAYEGRIYKLMVVMMFNFDGNPDVLKLDCEGGEFDILNNAPERDLTAFHWIVGEYHAELGDWPATLARVEQWFTVRAIRPFDKKFGLFCLERKNAHEAA